MAQFPVKSQGGSFTLQQLPRTELILLSKRFQESLGSLEKPIRSRILAAHQSRDNVTVRHCNAEALGSRLGRRAGVGGSTADCLLDITQTSAKILARDPDSETHTTNEPHKLGLRSGASMHWSAQQRQLSKSSAQTLSRVNLKHKRCQNQAHKHSRGLLLTIKSRNSSCTADNDP